MTGYRHKQNCQCKLCSNIAWNSGLTKKEYPRLSGGRKRGYIHSKKSKLQMSETKKKLIISGKFIPKSLFKKGNKFGTGQRIGFKHTEKALYKIKKARAKQIFPIKDTSIEVKIQEYLKLLGINFISHQFIKEIKHGYPCDIFVPSLNLIIECDGNYWHNYPSRTKIDNMRTKELLNSGFKILRIWESEIKVMDINQFKEKLGIFAIHPTSKERGLSCEKDGKVWGKVYRLNPY